MDVLERPGSYDGCAFSFSGKYGTSCFYQASIGMKLSPAGVEKVEDWMYSCQRNYSGLESLIEIDIADI